MISHRGEEEPNPSQPKPQKGFLVKKMDELLNLEEEEQSLSSSCNSKCFDTTKASHSTLMTTKASHSALLTTKQRDSVEDCPEARKSLNEAFIYSPEQSSLLTAGQPEEFSFLQKPFE